MKIFKWLACWAAIYLVVGLYVVFSYSDEYRDNLIMLVQICWLLPMAIFAAFLTLNKN